MSDIDTVCQYLTVIEIMLCQKIIEIIQSMKKDRGNVMSDSECVNYNFFDGKMSKLTLRTTCVDITAEQYAAEKYRRLSVNQNC